MTSIHHHSVSEASCFKFDDTETIILNTASQREDGIVLPIPESIKAKPDQVQRKLKRLLKAGMIEEVFAKLEDGLWRKDSDDRHLTLKLTPEGRRVFDRQHHSNEPETRQQREFDSAASIGDRAAEKIDPAIAQHGRKQLAKSTLTADPSSPPKASSKKKVQSAGSAPKNKNGISARKPPKDISNGTKVRGKKSTPAKSIKGRSASRRSRSSEGRHAGRTHDNIRLAGAFGARLLIRDCKEEAQAETPHRGRWQRYSPLYGGGPAKPP